MTNFCVLKCICYNTMFVKGYVTFNLVDFGWPWLITIGKYLIISSTYGWIYSMVDYGWSCFIIVDHDDYNWLCMPMLTMVEHGWHWLNLLNVLLWLIMFYYSLPSWLRLTMYTHVDNGWTWVTLVDDVQPWLNMVEFG
jgi:hypothetical protein